MATESLHCENGDHDWTRERKRGKKPTSCPEHKQQPVRSTPAPSPVDDNPFLAGLKDDDGDDQLARAREAKQEKSESSRRSLIQQARDADLEPENRRIADYCISQLQNGRQDVSHLRTRLEEIMKTYERRRRS